MPPDLLQLALSFLDTYGLVAVFVLLVLDGALLLPVLPGEAVMIMAVARYVRDLGDLVELIALTTAAGLLGSLLLYTIARVGGRPLVESHPRLFMMDRRRRENLEQAFQRPVGQSLVLFLRLIPLTRVLVNIPAGVARMRLGRFLLFSSIGMVLFHTGFLYLAYQYRQPGSGVALQAAALQEAYASPAWEYVQANEVVAGLGVLALGAFLSLKSSRRMLKYPAGATSSLLGWMAVRLLFFGSLAVAALLLVDPPLLYELALAGGLDLVLVADEVGLAPLPLVAYSATIAWSAGTILMALEARAKRKRDLAEAKEGRARARERAMERVRERAREAEQAQSDGGGGGSQAGAGES